MVDECEFIGDCGTCNYTCQLDCDTYLRKFLTNNQPSLADVISMVHEMNERQSTLIKKVEALTEEVKKLNKAIIKS